MHTDGEMSVGGDISAEVVYGHYNDHTLQAATIRARLVIEDEHCTIAAVEADTHFDLDDFRQGYGEGVQERLRELLVDEVFSDEEGEEQLDAACCSAGCARGCRSSARRTRSDPAPPAPARGTAYGHSAARTLPRSSSYSSRSRTISAGRTITSPPTTTSSGANCSRVRSTSIPMPRRFHQW